MYKRTEFGNNAQIKHERLVQRDAFAVFKNIYNEHPITECGLLIDDNYPFLCASPYKLYGHEHIVSIKCPVKNYNQSFDVVKEKIGFWKKEKGEFVVNQMSNWFIEIQGKLCVSGRNFAYLMIWLGEWQGEQQYRVVEISRDLTFFANILPKLTYFYNEVMLKELVDPRKQRHMELREYDYQTDTFV